MNDLLLIPVIFLAVGGILILLWRLFLIASGLLLIGFISFLIFVEGYGIYLFFTETELYTEDLAQNGLFGFTTFFIIFNLVFCISKFGRLQVEEGILTKVEKTTLVLLHFYVSS